MKRSRIIGMIAGLAIVLALAGIALSQASTNFNLRWWSFAGGGTRQSTNFLIQDSLGSSGAAASTNFAVAGGFVPGNVVAATPTAMNTPSPTATNTPSPTATHTPSPTTTPTATQSPTATHTLPPTATNTPSPTATHTPSPTATPLPNAPTATNTPPPMAGGDAHEDDDVCVRASTLATNNTVQAHTFHDAGDTDWIKFEAEANQSYQIVVENTGPGADAVVFLYDSCAAAPNTTSNNAFGSRVEVTWHAIHSGFYYIQLQQFDDSQYGEEVTYTVAIARDTTKPTAPQFPRCLSIDATTIAVQWRQNPELDVMRYRINYTNEPGTFSGVDDVHGGATTYYQLTGLTPGDSYALEVRALDFSGNVSDPSGTVTCIAQTQADQTVPAFTVQQPSAGAVHTTTAQSLTFTGLATDSGNNLSRVHVRNVTKNVEGWDYSLSGGSKEFRVADLDIGIGDNNVEITVFDDAGNSTTKSLQVRRLGNSPGAVIILAGHNETFGLQTNIYNATNRAYRIFKSAGFGDDDIYYLSPVPQDADGDGQPDTDGESNLFMIEYAITEWAKGRVGPDKPLFLYMMDHGLENKFCVNGCADGSSMTPDQLDSWLRELETDLDGNGTPLLEITIVYEACVSGSFIKREGATGSISRANRVVITSTGHDNNAYASAQGAFFSDAFFSCLADSGHLEACFNEGRQAVQATGVNQTPFLDDNGDGVYNSGDGAVARTRYVTRFFSSIRPQIGQVSVERNGDDGVLTARVSEGAEGIDLVWAAVRSPSFTEPVDETFNLNMPVVRLEPVAGEAGVFRVNYPNGFQDEGEYRIVFYAQDRLGINAVPVQEGGTASQIYLPVVAD